MARTRERNCRRLRNATRSARRLGGDYWEEIEGQHMFFCCDI
ncbi:hypothetical protein E6H20_07845 [Candidatus Bathyarchaeota archaeon]|nr:MAG: hypothetical protein E6H20_07845 [Candidatus Bathyarchaeota archaeon]